MFGVIPAGRPVHTNPTILSPTQLTFNLPYPPHTLNHVVLFLLPDSQLPPGLAATIHIQLRPGTPFRLLGALSNEKPSAVFRVRSQLLDLGAGDVDVMSDDNSQGGAVQGEVVIGIALEEANTAAAMLAAAGTGMSGASTPAVFKPQAGGAGPLVPAGMNMGQMGGAFGLPPQVDRLVMARRIIKNAFNYLSGFVVKDVGGADLVPLRAFQEWWSKFEKRVELDAGFLERDEE